MSKIIRKELTCPRCKGKGTVFDVSECVFTAGISFILGMIDSRCKDVCPECDGRGIICRKTIIEDNEQP